MQKSAARLWADLELWSCHRHNLKGWQQMQTGWFEPAELGWSLECITWISCTLLTQSWTAELSPPEPRWPYLPKDSKTNIAANAPVPGRHRAFEVSCDTSKFQWPPGSLSKNLPRVYELILNFGAVTATISKDGSKCKLVGLNLLNTLGLVIGMYHLNKLHTPDPILDCRAVITWTLLALFTKRLKSQNSG